MYGKTSAGVGQAPLVDGERRLVVSGNYTDAALAGRLFYAANINMVATSTTLNTTFVGLGLCNPTGSGKMMTLYEVISDICHRLTSIFLRNESGKRPVYGNSAKFQDDPHWREHILFYEYFHADDGSGIGASHQTGWTGMIATIISLMHTIDAELLTNESTKGIAKKMAKVSAGTIKHS